MTAETKSLASRLEAVLAENNTCADCPNQRPLWASYLRWPKKGMSDESKMDESSRQENNSEDINVDIDGALGVIICNDCAQHHHFELGKRRCLIKYLKYSHELTARDLDILEHSGNDLVNEYYEAYLYGSFQKDLKLEDLEAEAERRGKFIKRKYKKCYYRDHKGVAAAVQQCLALQKYQPTIEVDNNMTATKTTMAKTPANKKEGIQVICAGLGRTGTMSLTEALTILGYKPYHYLDFSHHEAWADLAAGKTTASSVIQRIVQDGYNATLENPTSDIYQDLLKEYPNAKVILTVRDTPQAFCTSWKTLFDTMVITEQKFTFAFPSFFGYIPLFANLKQIRYFMGTTHLKLNPGDLTHGWRTKGDAWLAEQYERHNQHVQEHVDSENVLVFNVKEGWEPLCKFLGIKEIPREPFPNVQINSRAALLQLRKTFQRIVYWWIPTTLTLGAAAFYLWARGTESCQTIIFPQGRSSTK